MNIPSSEPRTREQLQEHYEIEKELADRLRSAPRNSRLELYGSVYNELFRRVPLHPQLTKKADPGTFGWSIDRQVRIVSRFLKPTGTFLEVGAGDCALSVAVSQRVRQAYAVDVSDEIMRGVDLPPNVELRISNGIDMPVPENSIDVAYSNQVMEHLHPDDAFDQLRSIYRTLSADGVYVCITPNRMSGPHDISKHFEDEIALGFHLKEYTFAELRHVFKRVGFSKVTACVGGRGRYFFIPPFPVEVMEKALGKLTPARRRTIANRFLVSGVLGVRIIGRK
jgi:SAM-dependent methyltransferase